MTTVTSILKYLEMNSQDYSLDQNMDMHPRPKKRRLDHLTWEEKMQRKKLKNRVAAQTSRDRKKAKMEQMEHALQQLFAKNESVQAECDTLRTTNQRLVEENADLLARLQSPCEKCLQSQNEKQNRPVDCEAPTGSTESILQQKGRVTQSAALLLKIALSCLLYKTCSTNWTSMSTSIPWSNSPTAYCKTSQKIWRMLLKKRIGKHSSISSKWWGRHQQSWNPMGMPC